MQGMASSTLHPDFNTANITPRQLHLFVFGETTYELIEFEIEYKYMSIDFCQKTTCLTEITGHGVSSLPAMCHAWLA